MPKRDDVERLVTSNREIKGKVKAVGDEVAGGALVEVAPRVTDNGRAGKRRKSAGARNRFRQGSTLKRISMWS